MAPDFDVPIPRHVKEENTRFCAGVIAGLRKQCKIRKLYAPYDLPVMRAGHCVERLVLGVEI